MSIEIFYEENQTREDKIKLFNNNQDIVFAEMGIFNTSKFKMNIEECKEIFMYVLDNIKVPFYVVDKPWFRFKDTREIREVVNRLINNKEEVLENFNKAKEIYFYSIMQYPDDIENKRKNVIRYYALCEEDLK